MRVSAFVAWGMMSRRRAKACAHVYVSVFSWCGGLCCHLYVFFYVCVSSALPHGCCAYVRLCIIWFYDCTCIYIFTYSCIGGGKYCYAFSFLIFSTYFFYFFISFVFYFYFFVIFLCSHTCLRLTCFCRQETCRARALHTYFFILCMSCRAA